jgi:hypothetical protein
LRLLKDLIFLENAISLPASTCRNEARFGKRFRASEFPQKARGPVQEDSTRPRRPLTNVALMSVVSNDSIWMQFLAFALMHDAG